MLLFLVGTWMVNSEDSYESVTEVSFLLIPRAYRFAYRAITEGSPSSICKIVHEVCLG